MKNVRDILSIWPTIIEAHHDLKIPAPTIYTWRRRNSIQRKYWPRLIEAARLRGHQEVSAELLMKVHSQIQIEHIIQSEHSGEHASLAEGASGAMASGGHFSRHRPRRSARYASLAQINDHVAALRQEWDR
jgi:hypothetical protein